MVRLENLTKIFKDRHKEVVAVDNLNLSVEEGEFLTLLGPSGCGKTTTLRMIGGFEVPTTGKIFIGGEDVTKLPPNRRDTSMVFQSYALFPHMNVFNNIAYGLKIRRIPREEIESKVHEVLEMVNLVGLEDRYPGKLSGGQQQRVALARALVLRPKVLLLDEPLSNLDAKLREQMRFELKKIQRETGITFIYVTHDQAEAMVMSDRIVVMKDGKAIQIDPPDVIYRFPKNLFVATFIGRANIIDAEVVGFDSGNALVDAGLGKLIPVEIRSDQRFDKGAKVKLVVRPEGVRIGEGEFKGKIMDRVYMGSVETITIRVNELNLIAEVHDPHSKSIPNVGEYVSFGFSKTSTSVVEG